MSTFTGGEAGTGGAPTRGTARGGTGPEGEEGIASPLHAPAGTAMTLEGPVPYAGNILDNPDILWMDDQWTKDEVWRMNTAISGTGQTAHPTPRGAIDMPADSREGLPGKLLGTTRVHTVAVVRANWCCTAYSYCLLL